MVQPNRVSDFRLLLRPLALTFGAAASYAQRQVQAGNGRVDRGKLLFEVTVDADQFWRLSNEMAVAKGWLPALAI